MNNQLLNVQDFTNQHKISKTLRFKLIPVGNTNTKLLKSGILESDEQKAIDYPVMKRLLDLYYGNIIRDALGKTNEDWHLLSILYEENGHTLIEEKESLLRTSIVKQFGNTAPLFQADVIRKKLPEFVKKHIEFDAQEKQIYLDMIARFKTFTGYFKGFWETRKNVFSSEPIATSISNRIVNENYPIFHRNCKLHQSNQKQVTFPMEELELYLKKIGSMDPGESIEHYFYPDIYNKLCAQDGIECYNAIIGGISLSDGTRIQGYNEKVNLYNQQNKPEQPLIRLKKLKKQILAPTATPSFVGSIIEDDEDLLMVLGDLHHSLYEDDGSGNFFDKTKAMEEIVTDRDNHEAIFIPDSKIAELSNRLTGDWSEVGRGLELVYDTTRTTMSSERAKRYEDFIKSSKTTNGKTKRTKHTFSIKEIGGAVDRLKRKENRGNFTGVACVFNTKDSLDESTFYTPIAKLVDAKPHTPIAQQSENVDNIKEWLDFLMDSKHTWEIIGVNETNNNHGAFYSLYEEVKDQFDQIVEVYNRVRNYLTKKPSEAKKIRLNFKSTSFLEGWSESVINVKKGSILKQNGQYYLAITRVNNIENIFVSYDPSNKEDEAFEKMLYSQMVKPHMSIPRLTVSKRSVKQHFINEGKTSDFVMEDGFNRPFCVTKHIMDLQKPVVGTAKKYQYKYYQATDDYDGFKKALTEWITFCIEFLKSYENTAIYDYRGLKKPDEYEKIDAFYKDVEEASYQMTFELISKNALTRAIDRDEVFVFQIYNKDFSPRANGKPNLHTLYWNALFSDENIEVGNLKLDANAEVFFRKASMERKVTHPKGSVLLNKFDRNGKKIPSRIYQDVYAYLNRQKSESEICPEAKSGIESGRFVHKVAEHDIVKNKRYTEDTLLFHCPITINRTANNSVNNPKVFNEKVRELVKQNKDINIIGINRAERNLLYATVIDRNGKIIEQVNLDEIPSVGEKETKVVNYNDLLSDRESERMKARKSWKQLENIKDLKAGYLSQVVHQICMLMMKHKAIVVMENLDIGFKQGRVMVEKQVYQAFELALLRKLNHLVLKDRPIDQPGGALYPLQLTHPVSTMDDIFNQCGFVFYVSPAYTAKVDPKTGFTDLFVWNDLKQTGSLTKMRDFISRFEAITYNKSEDRYEFVFNYKDFGPFCRAKEPVDRQWTAVSYGARVDYFAKDETGKKKPKVVQLTNAFHSFCDDIKSTNDIKAWLMDKQTDSAILRAWVQTMRLLFQMRNRTQWTDHIVSPIISDHICFSSEHAPQDGNVYPKNAGANGAYHIAKKGKLLLDRLDEDSEEEDYKRLFVKNDDWFQALFK
ncbi:MAG: type V CRISPR-associated protein Cas12a/Cpf1 [Fastidiosipilaceae bacterium]|jgi:CRISPR-associated protein Cpf1